MKACKPGRPLRDDGPSQRFSILSALFQHLRHFIQWHGLAKDVALHLVAFQQFEASHLLLQLNSLRYHSEFE